MITKMLNTLPEAGQFVMVNAFEGEIWGNTMRWNEGTLQLLIGDVWYDADEDFAEDIDVLGFITADEVE